MAHPQHLMAKRVFRRGFSLNLTFRKRQVWVTLELIHQGQETLSSLARRVWISCQAVKIKSSYSSSWRVQPNIRMQPSPKLAKFSRGKYTRRVLTCTTSTYSQHSIWAMPKPWLLKMQCWMQGMTFRESSSMWLDTEMKQTRRSFRSKLSSTEPTDSTVSLAARTPRTETLALFHHPNLMS